MFREPKSNETFPSIELSHTTATFPVQNLSATIQRTNEQQIHSIVKYLHVFAIGKQVIIRFERGTHYQGMKIK